MLEMSKTKYPRERALAVAEQLLASLEPACLRIAIAGSLRRGKVEVGDVEIVFVPLTKAVPADLFGGTVLRDQAEGHIERLVSGGLLVRRVGPAGGTSWGAKNKLAVDVVSGIPVDLFSTTEECWWNYLVCRTGSADTNRRIATAAQAKGWKWNPYGPGFSRRGEPWEPQEVVSVESEQQVFEFVGLPYLPPERR